MRRVLKLTTNANNEFEYMFTGNVFLETCLPQTCFGTDKNTALVSVAIFFPLDVKFILHCFSLSRCQNGNRQT